MIFDFIHSLNFDFLVGFSKQFNIPVFNNRLTIPASLGEGHIKKVDFAIDFRLLVHRYKLKEDFIIRRNAATEHNDLISIFFYSNEMPIDLISDNQQSVKFSKNNDSAIQVTTSVLNSEIRFPANMEIYFTVVGISASRLSLLLNIDKPNSVVQKIINGKDAFLYFESMNQETQRILKQLSAINEQDDLSNFYCQIKAQELLYLLFEKLLKRAGGQQKAINNADVEKLMIIRNVILADLSKPPVLMCIPLMLTSDPGC